MRCFPAPFRRLLRSGLFQWLEKVISRGDWNFQSLACFLFRLAGTDKRFLAMLFGHVASILLPMTKPLADAWAKFNRAKIHSNSLRHKILAWIKTQGSRPIFRFELDEDASAGCLIIRVRRVKKLPPTWSLIAGDALSNFRACLDYLAWQLVQFGANPNPKVPENIGWPIYESEIKFRASIDRKLPGLLQKHRTLVEACQPYKGEPGKLNPLSVLNDLSRHDKHRQITVLSAAHKNYKMVGRVRYFTLKRTEIPHSQTWLPLKPGTELVHLFGKRTNDREPEMDMRFKGTTGIAFENGLWVLDVLARIENRIGNILANFEPLL